MCFMAGADLGLSSAFPHLVPLPGKSRGDVGARGLEPARPEAAAQRAWAPLQLLQRCKTASFAGSRRARPCQTLGPSPACDEASWDGASCCLSGRRGGSMHPHQRGCHPIVRDGPPSTSSQTRTQHMPSPGFSHVKQPQISPPSCQSREALGGRGPRLQPGAAQSLMKHTPSPDPYLEINEPVNPSSWDHHKDIRQSPHKESQELEQDLRKAREETLLGEEQRSLWGRASETLQEEMSLTTCRRPVRSASSSRPRQGMGPALPAGPIWKGGNHVAVPTSQSLAPQGGSTPASQGTFARADACPSSKLPYCFLMLTISIP